MTDGTQNPEDAAPGRKDPRDSVALGGTPGTGSTEPRGGQQPGHEDTMMLGVVAPPSGPGPDPAPGYGYPHSPTQVEFGSYQQPQAQQAQPQQSGPLPGQGGYGYPQPFSGNGYTAPAPFAAGSAAPDWEAMAEAGASTKRRRRRWWIAAAVVAVCLVGGGVGAVVVKGGSGGTPQAGSTGGASPTVPSSSPSIAQQPGAIADHSGNIPLAPGSDALVAKVNGSDALALRGNVSSYAEAADTVVDVTQSFTVSAWVYNDDSDEPRSALSQGDGTSFSFNLGRADSDGSKAWEFQIQAGGQGADSTTYQVDSSKVSTVNQWVLLTGAYDSTAHTISLYVNGAPAGSTKVPGIWNGPGPLEVGRARHHSLWDEFWTGDIGHIQVWNRALTAAEAADIKSGAPDLGSKPVDSWLVG